MHGNRGLTIGFEQSAMFFELPTANAANVNDCFALHIAEYPIDAGILPLLKNMEWFNCSALLAMKILRRI